ncbi:MAG: class I SAM-dependent methyltransferase [Chloroflexota bacterium]|nr:MAG: class I SAM-dependent methyltransferase [Chloroflexota bacterium]
MVNFECNCDMICVPRAVVALSRAMSEKNLPIMDYEGSRWREEFWRGREYEDAVERIAVSALLPPRGARLVEVGAGFGRLADLYRGYEQVILLDYARSMLKDARERLGHDARFIFVAADLYNLPLAENALDTALTIRVLHHVANIPNAFAEVARVVRPRGTYLTDFANKRHLKALVKYHLGRRNAVNPYSLEPYEFVKLNFDYHPSYISKELNAVGFEIREERAVSTFRIGGVKRVVPTSLLVSMDGTLQQVTAPLKIAPSIFFKTESVKHGDARVNENLWRCVKCHAEKIALNGTTMQCNACGVEFFQNEGIWELKAN